MASLIRLGDRAFLPLVAAALCSYVVIYSQPLNSPPIRADGYSYYLYLPAWFLYHDPSLETLADECCNGTFPTFSAVTRRFGSGAWINPHPIGTATLIAPFFLAGHLLTLWSNLKPDGFSLYYQHAAGLAGVVYLVAGLIFLTRHANALFVVYFPLYGVIDRASLAGRVQFLRTHASRLAVIVVTATALAIPQLLLYKAATGVFFGNPYDNLLKLTGIQAFDFAHPKILGVLFSVRKGLFFWSPILALSMAGFFVLRGTARSVRAPSLVFLPISVFLTASWWDWQFGGSYGHRAFTESLSVLAVTLAAWYQWAARRPRLAAAVTVLAAVAVMLSVAQMIQYWLGIIPFLDLNWTTYRASFLRFSR